MGYFSNDTFRVATVARLVDQGWDRDWAGLAAVVLHPLDDQPVPSRPFEELIRSAARGAAKRLRGRSQVQAETTIAACLLAYLELAEKHRERFYIDRYCELVRQLQQLPSLRTGQPLNAIIPHS